MGHELLDSGSCSIFGQSIRKDPYLLKNDIGHVSEKIRFDYPLTMQEFIPSMAKLYKSFDVDWFFKTAKEVNIPLNKYFGGYSRGQKMQIVLMAALAHQPKLLLIDEVTSVLDAFSRKYFMTILKQLTLKGATVVITTNIVNEVQFHCTDVIFLDSQKVKFQSSLSKITGNFEKYRVKDSNHPILQHEGVTWVGINSDGSQSYIVPSGVWNKFEGLEKDNRALTLEDLYIYHSQSNQ